MNKVPVTVRGHELLQQELKELKNVKRPAVIKAIAEARALKEMLEATRSRVLGEESFTLRTMAFQRELVDAMTVIEPDVPFLLRRLEEIARQLG